DSPAPWRNAENRDSPSFPTKRDCPSLARAPRLVAIEQPLDADMRGRALARLAVVATGLVLERGADLLDLRVGQVLDADELRARALDRADQFVELGLHRRGV